MRIQFEVSLTEDEFEKIKDRLGLNDVAAVAEWLAECYFWGSEDHINFCTGVRPSIDPIP